MPKRFMAVAFAVLFLLCGLEAQEVYIKSKYAKMRENPRKKKTIGKVLRGEAVIKQSKRKKWVQIVINGQEGWVNKRKITETKPKQDAAIKSSGGNAWAGEEAAAGSAIRGLSPTAQNFANKRTVTPTHRKFADYHQSFITITNDKIDAETRVTERGIEVVVVRIEDIEKFLEEGKLGEFGGGDE